MKCPRCGFDAPNTRFCPNCGLQMPVQQPTYQQPVPPVQNTPRAVPIQTADAHVVPMQSAARVTSVPSDAHLTAVTPPKSRNTSLLVAAIIIGAFVVSGIVIAVLSGIFYNRSVFSSDEKATTAAQLYTTETDSASSYPER